MWLILLFAIIPHEEPLTDRVDVIELNHCHNENGELTFSQWIFWRWNRADCRYHVTDWRLADSPASWTGCSLLLWDKKLHGLRRIHASDVRKSWTQHDVELLDREAVAPEHRRGLSSGPTPLKQRRNH